MLGASRRRSVGSYCKSHEIFIEARLIRPRMDEFVKLMTSDTVVFDYAVHNWILAVGGVVAIWTIVLLKDL